MTLARGRLLTALVGLVGVMQPACCRQVRRYPVPGPADLIGAVRKANVQPRSMRAKVTADQRTKKGRLKATVYLLAHRRGGLRMEATVLDNTVAVLTSDGQKFFSIDFKRKVVYLGPAKPCNIARIFGIPLRPGQVAMVLMGGMPLLVHGSARVSWDRCRGMDVLALRNDAEGLEQKIWIRRVRGRWRVERSQVRDGKGRRLLSIEFKHFVVRAGSWMPTWIRYVQPAAGTDVLLRYRKVEADVVIPQDAYRIDPPAGYPVRWLDCRDSARLPFEKSLEGSVGSKRNGRPPAAAVEGEMQQVRDRSGGVSAPAKAQQARREQGGGQGAAPSSPREEKEQ